MKKFFISLLKALGYFGIYLGAQFLVTFVYTIFVTIPVVVKYSLGDYNLMDPVIFDQYMDEIMQPVLDATMPLTLVSGLLTIGVVCLIFVCRKKKLTEALCLRKISAGTGVSVAMMGFGFNLLLGMLFMLLPEAWIDSYSEAATTTFAGDFWVVAITVAIMAPLVEEIVFRGRIYTRLKQGMPLVAAVIITSLWFGAMHGHPLWVAYASLLGFIMIWIFERTKSLIASMLFHFGYNLVAVIEMALPENAPDWVGIAMLAAGVVFSAIGVYGFLKNPRVEEIPGMEAPATMPTAVEAVPVTEETVVENTEETTETFK